MPPKLTDEAYESVRRVFEQFDLNQDGLLEWSDLSTVLKSLDGTLWTDRRIDTLFNSMDANRDRRVSVQEFIDFVWGGRGRKPRQDLFRSLDIDYNEFVNPRAPKSKAKASAKAKSEAAGTRSFEALAAERKDNWNDLQEFLEKELTSTGMPNHQIQQYLADKKRDAWRDALAPACSQPWHLAHLAVEDVPDAAMQELNSSLEALRLFTLAGCRTINDIQNPPAGVLLVSKALCWMLNEKPLSIPVQPDSDIIVDDMEYWETSRNKFWGNSKFINAIFEYDKDRMNESTQRMLCDILADPALKLDSIRETSENAWALTVFMRAMVSYSFVSGMMAPRREAPRLDANGDPLD